MKIILEGNELNFKSTIAEKLSEKLGYGIVKGSSFEIAKLSNEEMFNHYLTLANWNNVIIDRFIYSNLVYAKLYPNNTILSVEQVKFIERVIRLQNKTLLIYLYADTNTLIDRFMNRGDEVIKADELDSINKSFNSLIEGHSIDYTSFDTSIMSSDEIVDEVIKTIEGML